MRSPLLVAIILSATGLGIILPILKDAGETSTRSARSSSPARRSRRSGRSCCSRCSSPDESGSIGAKLVLLIAFFVFVAAIGLTILGLERSMRVSAVLVKLQDTTAEIRVRGAFLLLALFIVLASKFGLEAILGAFLAGATLKLVDRDQGMTHAFFHQKLQAVGFGVFIPFFFVSTGIKLDVASLFHGGSTAARVPIFLAALLVVRGHPGAALPAARRAQLAARRGRPAAGDVAQHPGRRRPDRRRDGPDPARELRRARHRRADLGDRLPAGRALAPARPARGLARRRPTAKERLTMRLIAILAGLAAVLALSDHAMAADRGTLKVGPSRYGQVLYDGRGFVLYAFTHDTKGKSLCTGACAAAWPPYLAKSPKAGAGAVQSLLGTTRRADGSVQVTYGGRPLYYYVGDRSPGQILCQNVEEYGGLWLIVRGSGKLVR